jgi:hypothetical protein
MNEWRRVNLVLSLPTLTPGRRKVQKVNERTLERAVSAVRVPRTCNPDARYGTAFTIAGLGK